MPDGGHDRGDGGRHPRRPADPLDGRIGIFCGILIFLPLGGATLEIVPAFWMVGMGILYMGRWPNGDPPAWAAGEARPWPTQAERRAEREEQAPGERSGNGKPALASGPDVAPDPELAPSAGGSSPSAGASAVRTAHAARRAVESSHGARGTEAGELPEVGEQLDRELASLLHIETFDPPAEFAEHALLNDPGVYERAAADPLGWWAAQAEELDWFQKWGRVLDDDDPPFYKWFTGGTLNVSYNCLDRHVIAGRGERVAFHWRGEDGQERDITYAELLGDVERFAGALKGLGVRKGDVMGSTCR